eukprot:jgi/Phyca11/100403/e_gw1.4.279.1
MSSIVGILKLCVALLVKHSVYLRTTLPPSHPILTTALSRDTEMMNELNASLVSMKPTGIPPHVEIYKQLQGVQQSIDNLPQCSGRATTSSAEQHTTGTAHYYDGKFHMLPKSFEFPKTEAFGAWMLWWFGDKARGYPPLRRISAHDLPTPFMRKTFSDWSSLLKRISDVATEHGCRITTNMSEEQAEKVFKVGLEHFL